VEKRALGKKVGYFGGTFDPIHYGHLHLAIQFMERYHLDTVLFCPTSISPFKTDAVPTASARVRLEMLQLALSPIEKFRAIDLEVQKNEPAYTIDTMRQLVAQAKQEHVAREFYLLLAEDHLPLLHKWKEIDELIALAQPLVASRSGGTFALSPEASRELSHAVQKGRVEMPLLDISSSEIRRRLSADLYCGHLVPEDVLDYIRVNRLY